jgi:adenylate kinase
MGSRSLETFMIVLVTGVPGVGKTTSCRFLARTRPDRYLHLPFGGLILRALNRDDLNEVDLRKSAVDLVTPKILSVATDMLVAQTAAESRIVLVDSHAVSQIRHGYVVTPDGDSYFARMRYNAIVQLFAPARTVLSRSEAALSGRQARTEHDIEMHFLLQSAVSVGYSAASECPLLLVDAEDPIELVAASVEECLQNALGAT